MTAAAHSPSMVAGWMVVRLARRVKVTVGGPSGVQAWPMASAHRCRLPSAGAAPGAVGGHDRQAGAGDQAGEITGLVGDLQDGPAVWLAPPPDLPALICGRVAVAGDRVGIGPVAAGLAAVISCCGVGPAVVSRRRAGDRCCG